MFADTIIAIAAKPAPYIARSATGYDWTPPEDQLERAQPEGAEDDDRRPGPFERCHDERRGERPEPHRGHQEPEAGGADTEDTLGERRGDDVEVHGERRDEPDEDDGEQHDRGRPDVAQTLGQVVGDVADARRPGEPGGRQEVGLAHQQQSHDHGDEAQAVEEEAGRHAEGPDQDPPDRRARRSGPR